MMIKIATVPGTLIVQIHKILGNFSAHIFETKFDLIGNIEIYCKEEYETQVFKCLVEHGILTY